MQYMSLVSSTSRLASSSVSLTPWDAGGVYAPRRPRTRMPVQRLSEPAELAALIRFLEAATR